MSGINLEQNLKAINKTNNKVVDILENPFVKYGFLIFIVIRIIFIDSIEMWYLELFNNTSVKIIYALLVAYSACFDPVYAIALTTFIIIGIQELYSRKAKGSVVSQVGALKSPKPFVIPKSSSGVQQVVYETMPEKSLMVNDENVFNLINKHTLQRVPEPDDKLIAEYDYYVDPAFQTLTANVENTNYLGHNKFYVSEDGLLGIQSNQEPNVNQNTSVQAFPKSMNIQGLPYGFDKGVGGANSELASINSN
jgi:hypothetical protein